jgi:hypothetical protein
MIEQRAAFHFESAGGGGTQGSANAGFCTDGLAGSGSDGDMASSAAISASSASEFCAGGVSPGCRGDFMVAPEGAERPTPTYSRSCILS